MEEKSFERSELLSLPISRENWFIIRNYALSHGDLEVYKKIITDYGNECSASELVSMIAAAMVMLKPEEYDQVVQLIFQY